MGERRNMDHNDVMIIKPSRDHLTDSQKEQQNQGEKEASELRKEIAEKLKRLKDLESTNELFFTLPTFFDKYLTFNQLESEFVNLNAHGITSMKLGDKEYPIVELINKLNQARQWAEQGGSKHSEDKHSEEYKKEVDSMLAEIGVTRAKIADTSKNGFREALTGMIISHNPRIGVIPENK